MFDFNYRGRDFSVHWVSHPESDSTRNLVLSENGKVVVSPNRWTWPDLKENFPARLYVEKALEYFNKYLETVPMLLTEGNLDWDDLADKYVRQLTLEGDKLVLK